MTDPTFVTVVPGQDHVFRLVLKVALLPIDDIDQPGRTFYRYADEQGLIGYVGLQGSGADRLLRSLIVLRSRRDEGHGRKLVELAEGMARLDGTERLHLLTKSAAPFFRELGYHDAERVEAPAAIAATAQFTTLCPTNAAYLAKALS